MSAFLPIEAKKINLCADYGFSSRVFNDVPNVYRTVNYKSCLCLKHSQEEILPNRIDQYRNHAGVYVNDTHVVIVLTETTIILPDNDAILEYYVIKPTTSFRGEYGKWEISFDEIDFSAEKPNFILEDYKLIVSGEWWLFDRGVIINGVSAYDPDPDSKCLSILIYFELHVDHTITIPSSDAIMSLNPIIQVTYNNPTSSNTQLSNNTDTPSLHPSNQTATISSLLPESLPFLNSLARPIITRNDNKEVSAVTSRAVIPSEHWLKKISSELQKKNIKSLLPKDYVPFTRPTMFSTSLNFF